MKITFFSNFLNHHQLPFCLEMMSRKGIDFKFVATEKIDEERIKLGYEDMNVTYDFVIRSYENEEKAYELAEISDVVIIGSAPQKFIRKRLKSKKLTFRYSERIFKEKFSIKKFLSLVKCYAIKERNAHLLCASAYAAYDFNKAWCFKKRTYKWGYFPENIKYDIKSLLQKKINNKKIQLLWVGRFLDWKHPEKAILVAKKLHDMKCEFTLKMVGTGEYFNKVEKMIKENGLLGKVELVGAVNYKKVRSFMEESNIFLFTSDYNEGWGAVLNEAMNSGCTVIASHAIGSVPFLIRNNYNGIIYNNNDINDLIAKVLHVFDNKDKQYEIGYNAYDTITSLWNAKKAVNNFLGLIDNLMKNKDVYLLDGPCSKAVPISNKNMYDYLVRSPNDKSINK